MDSYERVATADEHEWTDKFGVKWRATQDGLFEFDSSGYLREVCEGDVGVETPIEAPAREILRLAARVRELESELADLDPTGHLRKLSPLIAELEKAVPLPTVAAEGAESVAPSAAPSEDSSEIRDQLFEREQSRAMEEMLKVFVKAHTAYLDSAAENKPERSDDSIE